MIIDTIDNLASYIPLNPRFAKVVDYIAHHDLSAQPEGRVDIDGDDVFANFSLAKGKTREEAKIETHNRMVDIQIPFSGPEGMGYTPREQLPEQPYSEEKDVTFYDGPAEQYVTVRPGQFAIFFPQDGHAPCVTDAPTVQKVIFKVKG